MSAGRNINTLSQSWGTPHKYVNAVKEVFGGHIDLDPCSNEYSVVNAQTEYSSKLSGLNMKTRTEEKELDGSSIEIYISYIIAAV